MGSFIEQTPGDLKREARKRELNEKGIKDQETAVAVVNQMIEVFQAQREHVDELITEAFIKKQSPTDVILGILGSTIQEVPSEEAPVDRSDSRGDRHHPDRT